MTREELEEVDRLCTKVALTFIDSRAIRELMKLDNRYMYHESTLNYDLDIYIRKRKVKKNDTNK